MGRVGTSRVELGLFGSKFELSDKNLGKMGGNLQSYQKYFDDRKSDFESFPTFFVEFSSILFQDDPYDLTLSRIK